MKIILLSNFLNHHQKPFCDEMFRLIGKNYWFISTFPIPDEFIRAGYSQYENIPYHLMLSESTENEIAKLIIEADVVILGEAPYRLIKKRLASNKLTLKYSERILKESWLQIFNPFKLWHIINRHVRYRRKNLHLLCASAFLPLELKYFGAYPKKMYKWGYFTSVPDLDINNILNSKDKKIIQIIWVGRFIKLKHPELVLELASELKKKGYKFQITMIGSGPLWTDISENIKIKELSEYLVLKGNLNNDAVRVQMQKSDIFIFTSDRNEGWGAVLNEAMSSGCACVVADKIGSAPYLIEHEKNGLLFKSGNFKKMAYEIERLIVNENFRIYLSKAAYDTMAKIWNPVVAANNLILLSNAILNEEQIILEGPCSKV